MNTEDITTRIIRSPLGQLRLESSETGLCGLYFNAEGQDETATNNVSVNRKHWLEMTVSQLNEYFDGKRRKFSVPLDLQGTGFQLEVWRTLLGIPYGKQISYLQQAETFGNPKAIRAIAGANGKNPVSIIVPCHRVIGSDGSLIGYGGGVWRKKYLLELEQASIDKQGKLF